MPVELPAVAGPMVSPPIVTVTAAPPAIADVPVSVNTMAVAVGVAALAVLLPLKAAVALPDAAKKPDGYVSVMLLPAAWLIAPPALVANDTVAATGVLPATRSDAAIANKAMVV